MCASSLVQREATQVGSKTLLRGNFGVQVIFEAAVARVAATEIQEVCHASARGSVVSAELTLTNEVV